LVTINLPVDDNIVERKDELAKKMKRCTYKMIIVRGLESYEAEVRNKFKEKK